MQDPQKRALGSRIGSGEASYPRVCREHLPFKKKPDEKVDGH
jgi:hypothetical protein